MCPMSVPLVAEESEEEEDISYEVSVVGEIVNLTFYLEGNSMSISTNPQSALLLASDIIAAADQSLGVDEEEKSSFEFNH